MALRDDFNRADDYVGAANNDWSFPINSNTANDGLLIISNQVGHITSGVFSSYYSLSTDGPNVEAQVQLAEIDEVDGGAAVWVRITNPGELVSGYHLAWGGGTFYFRQLDQGVEEELFSIAGAIVAGESLKIRLVGDTIYGYRVASNGFETLIANVNGTLVQSAGYVGLSVDGDVFRLDNLFVGTAGVPGGGGGGGGSGGGDAGGETQTLDNIIFLIARRYGRAYAGETIEAGTINSWRDTGLIDPSKTWINYYAHWISGNNEGADRLVSNYDVLTQTITVQSDLANEPEVAETYYLLPLPYQYFRDAVLEAVRVASNSWVVIRDDATSLTFTTEQDYALPADLMSILDIYAGRNGFWYPFTQFEVVGNFGTYRLIIRDWPQVPVTQADSTSTIFGAEMRIVYFALINSLATAGQTLGIGEQGERELISFIQEYALYILHEAAMARNLTGEEARVHFSLAQQHYKNAMAIKANRVPQKVIRRMRTRAIPAIR